jgi:hypothetical protein
MSCFFDRSGRCLHPRVGGETTAERCGACVEYRGRLRGMGDVVAKVAEATGVATVARVVEKATGKPCGCAERRAALNKALPFTDQGV